MTNYYLEKDGKIVLADENKEKLQNTLDFIPEYQGLEIKETPDGYVIYDFEIMTVEEKEAKEKQKERETIAHLSLTRGDVFRGLLMARGVTRTQLRASIETNPELTDIQKEMALIDFDEALNFYRGNALIDTIGLALGIGSEQLDKFFADGNYEHLLPVGEETTEENSVVDEVTDEDTTNANDISI